MRNNGNPSETGPRKGKDRDQRALFSLYPALQMLLRSEASDSIVKFRWRI